MNFLQSIISENGVGSTKRTAVMWTAIPIWTFVNIMVFATKLMPEHRATLMFYDFMFMLGGLGIISLEKIFNKDKITTTGAEVAPEKEVTIVNGSNGVASSPLVVVFIALCGLTLASCSRKVAVNKSTEHTTTDVQLHTVDTTKSSATVVSTVQSFYGDTLQGSMFLTNDTTTGLPLYDSVQSGGIKFKIALQKTLGGYKGLYSIIAKPVSTLTTYQATNILQQGKEKDSTGSTDTAITTKTKTVQAPAFTFGKLVTIVVILSVVVMLCIAFKPKIYQAFGWVIHKITGNGNHT